MMKLKVIVIVESVEDAVKFYIEKLAFDLVDVEMSKQDPALLASATFRKGKFFIAFRQPQVEEFAAFSFIKRCASRCISVSIDLKRDIERFFKRCLRRKVKVVRGLYCSSSGLQQFIVRDPFGIEITFSQKIEDAIIPAQRCSLWGISIDPHDLHTNDAYSNQMSDGAVEHLRKFGIVRRAAKKLVKTKMKEFF